MNEDVEKVTIAITNGVGVSTRTITDEYDCAATAWPHLVQVFLEQLQGLGYKFYATPVEMVDVLEEFHQDCVCAECNDCDEDKEPVVEERKYPYTGFVKDHRGLTVVQFTKPKTGRCLFTEGHNNTVGEVCDCWAEEDFVPCL